jgi:hypothetical protein
MLIVDLPASFVSVIPADPNTLPAPSGRNPAPTRGAIETCPDGERDSSESESISEEETVTEAEPRSKAGTSDEAAAKTCTPESAADKSTPEAAAGKAPTEATATKTTSAETTATKTTSLTRVGSNHGTHEREGSQRNHHLTQHGTFLPARASASVFCSTNVPSKNAIEKEIITRSQHIDGVDVPDFFVTIAASARWGTDRLRTRDHSCSLKEKRATGQPQKTSSWAGAHTPSPTLIHLSYAGGPQVGVARGRSSTCSLMTAVGFSAIA